MQGGKAGEDSHRKFNAGWKTGRPWLDFRKVTTTDHDSAGNSVLVTAMFCKWCEMAGFNHNDRGKPTVWTDAGGILRCSQTQLCPSMRCTRSWCGSVAGEGGKV